MNEITEADELATTKERAIRNYAAQVVLDESAGVIAMYEITAIQMGATHQELRAAVCALREPVALWDRAKWWYDQRLSAWIQPTQEEIDYNLGVVPPIYFKGGFAVGEMYDYRDGAAQYLCFRRFGDTYKARLCSLKEAQTWS